MTHTLLWLCYSLLTFAIRPLKISKFFLTRPATFKANDFSLFFNLQNLKETPNPGVLARRSENEDFGTKSISEIYLDRLQNNLLNVSDRVSIGLWVRILHDSACSTKAPFLELNLPFHGLSTKIRLANRSLKPRLPQPSFESIEVTAVWEQWQYFRLDYMFSKSTKMTQVFVNDEARASLKESNSLFSAHSFEQALLVLGTDDFSRPFFAW